MKSSYFVLVYILNLYFFSNSQWIAIPNKYCNFVSLMYSFIAFVYPVFWKKKVKTLNFCRSVLQSGYIFQIMKKTLHSRQERICLLGTSSPIMSRTANWKISLHLLYKISNSDPIKKKNTKNRAKLGISDYFKLLGYVFAQTPS